MKIKQIIKDLSLLENLFDIIRIVDPITKKVYDTVFFNDFDKKLIFTSMSNFCYNFWNRNTVCENCISTRTIETGKSYMKIETNSQFSFIVTTTLIEYEGKKYVLELLRAIQDEDVITSINFPDYKELEKSIREKNLELVTDPLTKAYNRKFIDERIPFNLSFYKNFNKDFSLALCDLDHFKDVNDTYGHLAGDFVLKEFVSRIKGVIRNGTDWIARYGGDEFIIFIDNANIKSTVKIISKIKDLISLKPIIFENKKINITASFGIAKPNKNDTFNSIIKRADDALYISKKTDRNKISY